MALSAVLEAELWLESEYGGLAPVRPRVDPYAWAHASGTLQTAEGTRYRYADVARDYQDDLLRDPARRIIVAKSRQIGISQTVAFIVAAEMLGGGTALVVSRDQGAAAEFLAYVRTALVGDPAAPDLDTDNAYELTLPNGGRAIAQPATRKAGRSIAATLVVLDEQAWQEYAALIWTAILPTLATTNGRLIVLSTPNGYGNLFHQLWQGAKHGESEWSPHFLPWTVHPDWRAVPDWEERTKAKDRLTDEQFAQEYACHRADTLVRLAGGSVRRMIDLRVGDKVLALNEGGVGAVSVLRHEATGVRATTIARTESGTTFEASSDHPVMLRTGKTRLDAADHLVYAFTQCYDSAPNLALARLVGFQFGDGSIGITHSRYRKQDGTVTHYADRPQSSFYAKYRHDLLRLADDVVAAGLTTTPPPIGVKKGGEYAEDTWQIQLNGTVTRRLIALGCPVGNKVAQAFGVPEWIRLGSADEKAEFLAALWGAEGTTPAQAGGKAKACRQPTLKMHKRVHEDSVHFFAQLVQLHADLGIDTAYRASKDDRGWSFTIVVACDKINTRRFFSRIGFRYAEAKERAAFQWQHYYGAFIFDAEQRNRPQAARSFPRFADWIGARWMMDTLAVAIVDQSPGEVQPLYNILVDSPDHAYLLADGLNNHNCDFARSGSAVFEPELVDALWKMAASTDATGNFALPPVPGHRYVSAWDIARKQDAFVGFTFDVTVSPFQVVAYERHLRLSYPDQARAIEARHARYPGETWVESNGVGDPLIQFLAIIVKEFQTTALTKRNAIDALLLLLQRHELISPPIPQWSRELLTYQRVDQALQQDTVMAAAIAASAAGRPPEPSRRLVPLGKRLIPKGGY
jgi:hypothetical protein